MHANAAWGPYAPDTPTRRLPWVLAAAVLLVLLAFLGLGQVLQRPEAPETKPKTMETRIYELPNSPGSLPGSPAAKQAEPSTRTGKRAPKEAKPAAPPAEPKPSPPVSHESANGPANAATAPAKVEPAPAGQPTPPAAAEAHPPSPPPKPAPAPSPPKLNWSTLQASVQSAVDQTARDDASAPPTAPDDDASLPNVHDPHTLVARYYIASLLRKLQRVGDMNYPTDQIGTPVLRLTIGAGGQLQKVSLIKSSGNDNLDRNAVQIAHQSSPFPPFPDSLKRKTSQIVLICHMSFEGYRQISPRF